MYILPQFTSTLQSGILASKEQMSMHTTWMVLKGIVQREKSQSRNVTYCVIPFTQHSQ